MNRLTRVTTEQDAARRKPRAVNWYRSPIDPKALKALHQRSDWRGAVQTLGYLGVITATGAFAVWAAYHLAWYWLIPILFLHGTVYNFQINAIHELSHGTVFKTRALNRFFSRFFAFLGWENDEHFNTSHTLHHRYTLHPPDDLEVVLPVQWLKRYFWTCGFILPPAAVWEALRTKWRFARGQFCTEWERALYSEDQPEKRRAVIRQARVQLIGHAALAAGSIAMGWWMIPVVITLANFYGKLLFLLCNTTQHIGLQDEVSDFRLCCRTFTLNPVVRFLYWQMNYHIEHHMYAAVPCYNLPRLHEAILHDLPPCPSGIAATWREIFEILRRQEVDPDYQYVAPLPGVAPGGTSR